MQQQKASTASTNYHTPGILADTLIRSSLINHSQRNAQTIIQHQERRKKERREKEISHAANNPILTFTPLPQY
ncbi:hypothetical protein EYC80_001726 [Monilinia laxa]|uniref:Uncharacterized protein n=1 Tax=Monilinia laxa TaxID=61186 RepID=A0A5N6K5U4_MONLA|nr:hypothetical protein EYC80_001726 [Monilinia laxa]